MRCNIHNKQLPHNCPKCGSKLKSEKCKCGHVVCQEKTNEEKEYDRRLSYGEFPFFRW